MYENFAPDLIVIAFPEAPTILKSPHVTADVIVESTACDKLSGLNTIVSVATGLFLIINSATLFSTAVNLSMLVT